MKYNNKLDLVKYLQLVEEISNEYFDMSTYEYVPHIGELYSVCAYFNNCVELEDIDEIKKHPITDLMDMQMLYDNKDFMEHYRREIMSGYQEGMTLTFGSAYVQAMEIVDYKKNDANSVAIAISATMSSILKSFRDSFNDESISKITEIAQQIVEGKITNESIIDAYEKSDRFKANTESINETPNDNILPFPSKK